MGWRRVRLVNESGEVRLGAVVAETMRAYRSRLRLILTISVLLSLPFWLLPQTALPDLADFLLETVVGLVFNAWSIAAVVLITWGELHPQHAAGNGILRVLKRSLTLVPAMVLLNVFIQVGVGLGLVLLVVPGLVLFAVWIVAQPVLALERSGITGSLLRSQKLTEGLRTRLVWVALVLLVITVVSSVPTILSDTLPATLISYLATVVLYPFIPVAMTVTYGQLVNQRAEDFPDDP